MQTGYDRVVLALEALDLVAILRGPGNVTARCPAHDDSRASLSVSVGDDGRALVYCFAGCETPDVVAALDLSMSDLFEGGATGATVDAYVYTDEQGVPLYRVLRRWPKGFTQQRWDPSSKTWEPGLGATRRVPYHLPALMEAKKVYLVEGEKDVEVLRAFNLTATTIPGGANNWKDQYAGYFKDKVVTIIADNDEPGIGAALKARTALKDVAQEASIFLPLEGKDVTDHINAGRTLGELIPYTEDVDIFDPWDPWEYETPADEWLFKPYVPRHSRVLLHGEAGSLKTLWAMWLAAKLAGAGDRVAFFSTEMNKGQIAKRFKRLPKSPNLKVFGRFTLGMNLGVAVEAFEGYSLLVIDSWSSAQGDLSSNDNDGVARLDVEFFQPLVRATGATILLIDNTGHAVVTQDGLQKRDTARGASRKRDIQEVELWFHRPDKGNNFRTSIEVTKMRLDEPIPAPRVVETAQDEIEFYDVISGMRSTEPMWPGLVAGAREAENEPSRGSESPETASEGPAEMTALERRQLARLKDRLGATEIEEEAQGG